MQLKEILTPEALWTEPDEYDAKQRYYSYENLHKRRNRWLKYLAGIPFLPTALINLLRLSKPQLIHQSKARLKQSRGDNRDHLATLEGLMRQGIGPWELVRHRRRDHRPGPEPTPWKEIGQSFTEYFRHHDEFPCDIDSFKSITASFSKTIKQGLNGHAQDLFNNLEGSFIDDGARQFIETCKPAFLDYIKQRQFKQSILEPAKKETKKSISQQELIEIINRYPGLISRLNQWLSNYKTTSIQLCQRLAQDRQALKNHFSLDVDSLVSIDIGRGDRHHNGASTSELKFQNGKHLFYKPRSLALEIEFGVLTEQLCHQLNIDPFNPTPKSLDRGNWGYQDKINSQHSTPEYNDRLISRLALMIVLIDILGAIDCIDENLVICKDKPILIDGETLLHESGTHPALKPEFEESIVMSGLFERTPPEITQRLHSLTTIKPTAVQILMQELERIYTSKSLKQNIHRFLGRAKAYNRTRRVVFRSTAMYSKLLAYNRQAKTSKNPAIAELTFEKLYDIAYQGNKVDPRKFDLAFAEEIQLKADWIPYFSTKIGKRKINGFSTRPLNSGHHARVDAYAKQRLKFRQRGDYQRQIKIIQAAVSIFPKNEKLTSQLSAKALKTELIHEAIFYRNWGWLNADVQHGSETLRYRRNQSLYDGKMGIALFLNAAREHNKTTNDTDCAEIVQGIANESIPIIRDCLKRRSLDQQSIGLDGLGGYFLAASILKADKRSTTTEKILSDTMASMHSEAHLDIMFGLAGLAGGVHAWTQHCPSAHHNRTTVNLLKAIGESLLNTQEEQGYWTFEGRPQTGFAHGTSGIMAALAMIAKQTQLQVDDALERAIQFELNQLKAHQPMIGDHLISNSTVQMVDGMWCRGSAGILLAMAVVQQSGMQHLRGFNELTQLVKERLFHQLPDRDQLCCGIPGVSMSLAAAARVMDDEGLLNYSQDLKMRWIQSISSGRQPIARTLRNGTIMSPPGLFTGRAGLGLFLLDDANHAQLKDQIMSCGLLTTSPMCIDKGSHP